MSKSKDSNHRRGISELFIQRPITTTLVMVGIVLFGLIGYAALPVSDLPTVDYPTINVNASLPGANPETMAASVATPLERAFSGIAGIDSINSSNSQGSTSITLQFDLSRDIDAAAQDVQTAISSALTQLPAGMPAPPSLRKVNPADSPILYMSLNSPVLPLSAVDEYAETLVAQRISIIDGVENTRVASWFNGSRGVTLAVQRQPGTNTVAVVDDIRKLIPQFREQLPASVSLDILYDRSISIRESVNDVQFSLMLAVVLVV